MDHANARFIPTARIKRESSEKSARNSRALFVDAPVDHPRHLVDAADHDHARLPAIHAHRRAPPGFLMQRRIQRHARKSRLARGQRRQFVEEAGRGVGLRRGELAPSRTACPTRATGFQKTLYLNDLQKRGFTFVGRKFSRGVHPARTGFGRAHTVPVYPRYGTSRRVRDVALRQDAVLERRKGNGWKWPSSHPVPGKTCASRRFPPLLI